MIYLKYSKIYDQFLRQDHLCLLDQIRRQEEYTHQKGIEIIELQTGLVVQAEELFGGPVRR
jgi:hypothetical protein